MFRFADPQNLYWLLAIPVLVIIYIFTSWQARKRLNKYGDRQVLRGQIERLSVARPIVKFALLCVALGLIVVMLARPQYGLRTTEDKRKGIEAVIVLDVSNSMLAGDVEPSRLERSKLLVSTLIDRMKDDKVGLTIFAGEAYPLLPITNDYVSAKMFLDNISTGMVSLQGTNVAAAIRLGAKNFTQEKGVGKAIIIITDGEDHEGDAVEAAKEAAKEGKRVYMLGVGSTTGTEIPTENGPLTDNTGAVVRTALNEEMCREVAEAGKGIYIHVDNSNLAQDKLQNELQTLQRKESTVKSASALDEQFQAVALILLLLLIVEFFMLETQNPFFKRLKLFSK